MKIKFWNLNDTSTASTYGPEIEVDNSPTVFPSDDNPIRFLRYYGNGERVTIGFAKPVQTVAIDSDGLWVDSIIERGPFVYERKEVKENADNKTKV